MTKPQFHIKFVDWDSANTNPDIQPCKYGLFLYYPIKTITIKSIGMLTIKRDGRIE